VGAYHSESEDILYAYKTDHEKQNIIRKRCQTGTRTTRYDRGRIWRLYEEVFHHCRVWNVIGEAKVTNIGHESGHDCEWGKAVGKKKRKEKEGTKR
jgi:hypothetical protein